MLIEGLTGEGWSMPRKSVGLPPVDKALMGPQGGLEKELSDHCSLTEIRKVRASRFSMRATMDIL
jgi:hypothetical protein